MHNVRKITGALTVKSTFDFLTHLHKLATFLNDISSQRGEMQSVRNTTKREISTPNVSGGSVIDSPLHKKFNRWQTLITVLFMETKSNSDSHRLYTLKTKQTNIKTRQTWTQQTTIMILGIESTKMIIMWPTEEGWLLSFNP